MNIHLQNGTIKLENPPYFIAGGAVGGQKESEGPLCDFLDEFSSDGRFDRDTWEKAESEMQKHALYFALNRANLDKVDFIFSGDLLNQCTASAFAHRESNTSYVGLYGACSTFVEGLCLSSVFLSSQSAEHTAISASSHFCSAERQYRYPLNYGGQRPPTAQWTVTGAGAVIMGRERGIARATHVNFGKIVDMGIKDANNMGAAMAPAAFETINAIFKDTNTKPNDYDLIVTGDLGFLGKKLLCDLFKKEENIEIPNIIDCGEEIFSKSAQDVHSGASGAGCSACVFSRFILEQIKDGRWKKVLFAGTGALLSPLSTQQGESIPCICHGIVIEV
ncbi:MAG: stage V sporulation protein AD [Clostridia bacterium]|nr:stage V sporulation protein AD [Clostridia bacterium]